MGIFFVTQSPMDIPESVLGQLGNKIQHALRAYTPKELKDVRAIAQTFRESEGLDVAEAITSLQTGQAVVSPLDPDGTPMPADIAMIYPPKSKIGTLAEERYGELMRQSPFLFKYEQRVNRESAYEMLSTRAEQLAREQEAEALRVQLEKEAKEKAKKEAKNSPRSNREGITERFTKNIAGTVGREVGRHSSAASSAVQTINPKRKPGMRCTCRIFFRLDPHIEELLRNRVSVTSLILKRCP